MFSLHARLAVFWMMGSESSDTRAMGRVLDVGYPAYRRYMPDLHATAFRQLNAIIIDKNLQTLPG